ncbi:LppU/SCO3897 family protein [Pseudonocardia sp. CA-107938]|uniref:LppU/SCO3897 family protein n=1 Tax=Pseudonocardia sp. CA-107938 TaxID=3240021 RepID=UPI003D93C2FF
MSTPFAPQMDDATARIEDQSWPAVAEATTHLPSHGPNATTQYMAPQYGMPQQYAAPQWAPQYPQPPYPGHFPAPQPYHPAPAPQFAPPSSGWITEEETVRYADLPSPAATSGRAVAEQGKRRRRNVWISLLSGVTVATGVLIGGAYVIGNLSDAPASAVVGDCLARSGDGAVVVPCSDAKATFTVLGRLESRTEIEASMSACSPFPQTTDVYWQGRSGAGERGLVLCLGPAKK